MAAVESGTVEGVVADKVHTVTLGGQELEVYEPNEGQWAALVRLSKVWERGVPKTGDPAADFEAEHQFRVKQIIRIGDLFDSLFVNPDDLEFIDSLVITRKLDITELLATLMNPEGLDAEPPAKVPAKRVGRARRS
jgi:hypothetical protein